MLTKGLTVALNNRAIESRREYHRDDEGIWHFVVAHGPVDAAPSHDDIITDLNPWQFMEHAPGNYTYLHASRGEIMDRLEKEGAPDYFIALRSLETIVHAHTDMLQPKP